MIHMGFGSLDMPGSCVSAHARKGWDLRMALWYHIKSLRENSGCSLETPPPPGKAKELRFPPETELISGKRHVRAEDVRIQRGHGNAQSKPLVRTSRPPPTQRPQTDPYCS